jgi:cyclophilin family peptidyl-prolyl cis-trans isomerase
MCIGIATFVFYIKITFMKNFNTVLIIVLLSLVACDKTHPNDGVYADIKTAKGTIIVQLHFEDTPITVANFVALTEGTSQKVTDSLKGKRFYDGLPFHRVIPNFMIQGGDIERNGKGNPGYTFEDEFPKDSLGNLLFTHDSKGILSMANSGPHTNGSQFFITHTNTAWLDGKHTVFGKVINGLDIIDSIQQNDKIISIDIVRKGRLAKIFSPDKAIEKARIAKIATDKLVFETRKRDSIQFAITMNEASAQIRTSGLKIVHVSIGKGKRAQHGDRIKVHYKGYFSNGKVFDSSYKRNKPFEFTIGVDRVIEGWTEGMALLNAGGKARFFIPYELAYGATGYGLIPAKSNLIFEVELLEIVK